MYINKYKSFQPICLKRFLINFVSNPVSGLAILAHVPLHELVLLLMRFGFARYP